MEFCAIARPLRYSLAIGWIAACLAGTVRADAPDANSVDPRVRVADFLAADGRDFAVASELLHMQANHQILPPDAQWQLADSLRALGLNDRAQNVERSNIAGPGDAADGYGGDSAAGGNTAQAVTALQATAAGKGADPESAARRDRAYLTLGYLSLHNRQGDAAGKAFSQVRSPGIYANQALLGLGWSYLLASPASANHGSEITYRHLPIALPDKPGDRQEALRRALVPWVELTGRNPLDPAVQEGMLAIAFALEHLDAHQQSYEGYQRAVLLFERNRGWFDQAIQHVTSHRMAELIDRADMSADNGWHWWFANLPSADAHWWLTNRPDSPLPENFYIEQLLSDEHFQTALKDYCGARRMQGVLDEHVLRLSALADDPRALDLRARIEALRPRIESAHQAQRQQLEDAALAELKREKQQTEGYLGEAHFALARVNDRPPEAPASSITDKKKKDGDKK